MKKSRTDQVSVARDRCFVRNLDWNLVKVFHEIARNGGVTNAAAAISRQQPAVSSALKRLEDYLGKNLCERGPGGFALTDHGARLARIAEQMDQLACSLQAEFDEIDNDLSIQLQIATVCNVVCPRFDRAIRRFAAAYPKAELYIHVAPYPQIEDMVLAGEADLGVCPDPRLDERLEYSFLYREHHLVVCGSRHRLAGRTITDLDSLANEAFVVPGTDEARLVREFRSERGWGQKKAGQSPDIWEVKRLLHAGIGISLLPLDMVEREIEEGTFWPLTKPIEGLSDDIHLVTNRASSGHFAARKFLEFLPQPDEESASALSC
ncbi:LysR family transcriptional regulator [Rhizobiales bacterium]|uniref:LysR family transcriptional regulator n=1 Tax=Hongsoonwoonella zoysiae TaxID=2821844 RepID=UPI001560FBC8|nr:LysR family transcriptional regulator [Hongsoonwoonella zoysiae]NRG17748.1 LysR family transcriptional regulator [Hongsoonwoonella zoysiae]